MNDDEKKNIRLVVAREYLKQHGNSTIADVVDIIGLELFAILLISPSLAGKRLIFPRASTLKRLLMKSRIRNEMKSLKPDSYHYQTKLKELSVMFGVTKSEILRLMKRLK